MYRSGTNYVQSLLVDNYYVDVFTNRGSWKHGYHVSPHLGMDIVVSSKDPYSWLVSMHRHAKSNRYLKANPSFSVFLRDRLILQPFVSEDLHGPIRSNNPVDYWNNMYYHWYHTRPAPFKRYVLRYEDILEDPTTYIEALADTLRLSRRQGPMIMSDNVAMPSMDAAKKFGAKKFEKTYYTEKKYLDEYNKDDLAFVNENLDKEVMELYKYEMENER